MREIKYRGKRVDNGEWVYGKTIVSFSDSKGIDNYIAPSDTKCLAYYDENRNIVGFKESNIYLVDNNTIGQYIDWEDKNDKEIYEGDILMTKDLDTNNVYIGVVDYNNASFYIESDLISLYRWVDYEVEIIGNIHDNPELLEVKE